MDFLSANEYFLLSEIVKRNFASKYKGSVLGILWSILRPLLIMIILTIVFSTLFTRTIENYPVYILSGKCIYDFFSGSIGTAMIALSSNKNILQRTPAPKYIFIVGCVLSEFINFIITMIILVAVMIVTKSPFHFLCIPFSIIPILSGALAFTGLGLILSIFSVLYKDVQYLWSVFTQLIFYSSAIFFPMDIIPEPYHQYMVLNPLFWIIDQFRDLAIYGVFPSIINILNLILISVIILIIGIIIFEKYEKTVTMKF